jgi:hypothetical protein
MFSFPYSQDYIYPFLLLLLPSFSLLYTPPPSIVKDHPVSSINRKHIYFYALLVKKLILQPSSSYLPSSSIRKMVAGGCRSLPEVGWRII